MGGAFIDARCAKCDADISWFGKMSDRPPCPKCGHQLTLEELKSSNKWWEGVLKEVDTERKALLKLCQTEGTPERAAYLEGQAERAAKPPRKVKNMGDVREVAGAGVNWDAGRPKRLQDAFFNGYRGRS